MFFLECVLNRSHASLLEEVYDNYTSFKQFYNSYIVCLIFDLSSSLDLSNGNQISTNFQVPGSWRYVISLLIVDWILSFQLLKKQPHERLGGGPDDSKPIKVWWNQGHKISQFLKIMLILWYTNLRLAFKWFLCILLSSNMPFLGILIGTTCINTKWSLHLNPVW